MTGTEAIRTVAVATATLWTGPDAPRPVDAPALAAASSVREWAARMTHEERLDLHGRVESQVLLGDRVLVVEERPGWAQVVVASQPSSRDPRGYPGWLPAAQLTDVPLPDPTARQAVVRVPTTSACDRPGGSVVLPDVSFATILPLSGLAEDGWLPVRLPGRTASGWLPADDVEIDVGRPGAADLLAAAGQFVGLAYVWGGTSGLGWDCSGLVHAVLRRYGRTVPRDAHDQAAAVAVPVDPAVALAGDLLFFARPGQPVHHVGICAGAGRMLHAPETGRGIAYERLSPERARTLVRAGRWW